MKRFFTTLLFTAFALVGCEYAVEVLPSQLVVDAPDFYAEITEDTRTQLNDSNRVLWCADDFITIFLRDDHNLKYKIKTLSESRTNATFTFTRQGVTNTGEQFLVYYGVYPYSEYNKAHGNTLSLNLPSNQPYVEGSELKNVPMVALSTDLNLPFQAPTSLLRIKVSRDDLGGDSYTLKQVLVSSESTYISGMVDVDMLAAPCKAVVDESSELKSRHISIDLGDGVELSTDAQSFYAALVDATLPADDLSLTFVVDANGKSYDVKKKISAEIHYQAGRVYTAPVKITADDFTPSNGNSNGGDITESDDFILNDDGSYSCPITEDMIIDEPLYLPNGTTATISLGENATLSNSTYNVNSALVVIDEGADLTIDGSGAITSITATALASTLNATRAADDNTAFPIVVNGTLRIKGGDFTLNSFATSWLNCGIYVGPKGKLIIEDGRFHSPKGSFIFGHEHGNRPEIIIHGGRFEGYDPSDNDFDGEGSNYLEPEYASYFVAEDELVVASRTAEWEVDNSYLLKSIIENGGTAHLVVPEEGYFELTESMSVNYPVTIDISNSTEDQCRIYFDGNATMFRCYSDLTIGSPITFGEIDPTYEMPKLPLFYLEAVSDIATVYEGGSLTVNNGEYFGGTDGVTTSLFNSRGGDITINNGAFSLDIIESNTITVEGDGQVVIYDGDFYNNFDPANVNVNGEIKSLVAPERYSVALLKGGYGVKKKGTFTAASYNIDGLPSAAFNFDGPESDGTNSISQKLAADAWDIIAFQEDFNFHDNLISSMKNIYTFGKHRGTVGLAQLTTPADTDGLGFATLNSTSSFANQTFVEFTDKYGGLTDGANDCIKKGFRYYLVTLAGGAQIDVYVTHMNSGSKEGHINARASQFQQLAQYIASNNNGNPVVVLGDFNARYTRDNIQTNFHNNLGAFAEYLSDAWVELVDKCGINGNILYAAGVYPESGNSLVVQDKYDSNNKVNDIECTTQGGEVVDKILYMNNPSSDVLIYANSFERDMDYTEADHTPVVSEFTYYY